MTAATIGWGAAILGLALFTTAAIRILAPHPGTHPAPPARYRVWDNRVVPAKATRSQPPPGLFPPLPPPAVLRGHVTPGRRTWTPALPPATFAAMRVYAGGLVREASLLAEVAATRPWADDTHAFSRWDLNLALAGAA